MKVLIAGGRGFIGTALRRHLGEAGHEAWILTRRRSAHGHALHWDGRSEEGWTEQLERVDAVVNLTGYGLEHWPWSEARKRRFLESRVIPGQALTNGIRHAVHRPRVFVQISGINYYGTSDSTVADESCPAGSDFLAGLTVAWEAATESVESMGVRRVVARNAVVLDSRGGLFPLMALSARLFAGGPIGAGTQVVPWIHLRDLVRALQFLLEHDEAKGVFNLVAPAITTNEQFMRATAAALRRPYWLRMPAFLLRALLGEMSMLVVDGGPSVPRKLLELGFRFEFPTIEESLRAMLENSQSGAAKVAA
jgi:uncharacterized protein